MTCDTHVKTSKALTIVLHYTEVLSVEEDLYIGAMRNRLEERSSWMCWTVAAISVMSDLQLGMAIYTLGS